MRITVEHIGKKYGKSWIFKDISLSFEPGQTYAILGDNGSGKSTLLKLLSGQTAPNQGEIEFENTAIEQVHQKISYCAPYIDLIEELTLDEFLDFVEKHKPFLPDYPKKRIVELFAFDSKKWIKDYSSGMKQRVKLALALFADVELCLLDEPTSNLDEQGVEWYLNTLEKMPKNRTLIIASNLEREYGFCAHKINMNQYKK